MTLIPDLIAPGDPQRTLPAAAANGMEPPASGGLAELSVELRDLLASAILDSSDAVTITVADIEEPTIVFVNPAFTRLTGYSAEEVVGRTPRLLQGPRTDRQVLDRLRADLTADRRFHGEAINYRKDGSEFWLEWEIAPVCGTGQRTTHFVATQRDVSPQRERQEAAERSILAKTLFLSRISHELLTPVTSLIGFPELLVDGHFGPLEERQHQAVTNVLSAAYQLRHLINDLLDLARLEAGRIQLVLSQFDIGALLADLTSSTAAAAQRKNVTLQQEIDERLPAVCGDPSRLKQVVLNLLDNAVKYTPAGGRVRLAAWPAVTAAGAPSVRLAVTDSGVGIDAEDHERIFHMFEQVDPSLTRRQAGTGLGLALVKRILDLHRGRVWVESAGVGKGSAFHVEIPVQQATVGE
jgi:PAS domain S-box-containing protein